jgi:transcriptional regulator with XRE-family HTH domain
MIYRYLYHVTYCAESRKMLVAEQPGIGKLVRGIRTEIGLTQEKFATKLGVTFPTINRWENGRVTPSPLAMEKIGGLLSKMGERGQSILSKYFPEQEQKL